MKNGSGLDITDMNMIEYYLAFAGNHTALSTHYAKQVEPSTTGLEGMCSIQTELQAHRYEFNYN